MAEAEGQDVQWGHHWQHRTAGGKCWPTASKWWHKAREQTGIPRTKVVLETGILRKERRDKWKMMDLFR